MSGHPAVVGVSAVGVEAGVDWDRVAGRRMRKEKRNRVRGWGVGEIRILDGCNVRLGRGWCEVGGGGALVYMGGFEGLGCGCGQCGGGGTRSESLGKVWKWKRIAWEMGFGA